MSLPTWTVEDYHQLFPEARRALAMHEALRHLLDEGGALPESLPALDAGTIEAAWQSGRPIVDRLTLGPSAEPIRQLLQRVSGVLRQHLPNLGPLETLADSQRLGDARLLDVANEIASGEPGAVALLGRTSGAHPTGAAFVVAFTLAVFYHAIRRHLPAELDLANWQRQSCPVCAASPAIAKARADGLRAAYCHRCGSHWQVPAELCLSCGSKDSRARVRIPMAGQTHRWAEACRTCRQYTKIVDETALGALVDLYYEDVITHSLDERAREAAFRLEEPALSRR